MWSGMGTFCTYGLRCDGRTVGPMKELIADLGEGSERDTQVTYKLILSAFDNPFRDVGASGERRSPQLRGEPVALVSGPSGRDLVQLHEQLVACGTRAKPLVGHHAAKMA